MKPMVKAATMVGLLFAAAVVAPLACSPFGGASAFVCDDDTDCQGGGQTGGRCEQSTGFCAFADDSCGPLGRYGELAGGLSGQCVESNAPADTQEPDGPPIEPDDVCVGTTGGLVVPCWAPTDLPNTAVALTADIDTDASSLCSSTVKNATQCVVAGSAITLGAGITIRVTGSKPLVLVSTTGAITLDGVIDAASHIGVATLGASANFAGCDPGTAANTGGGGAGGSFGTLGGNGGNGRNVAASAGTAGAAQTPAALRGGCIGQIGDGTAGQRGEPGAGGGAVYLIGKTSISIGAAGGVNASGAGATNGTLNSVGGGGGGSGGMIGFDSPTIANNGTVFANGGGGGEGSGQTNPAAVTAGSSGDDPTGIGAAPGGSLGSTNGGDGSAGGAGAVGGVTGLNGSATGGGGGGGGGTGVIKVFGGGTLAGNRSPAPS
jgi:hypothetical protein